MHNIRQSKFALPFWGKPMRKLFTVLAIFGVGFGLYEIVSISSGGTVFDLVVPNENGPLLGLGIMLLSCGTLVVLASSNVRNVTEVQYIRKLHEQLRSSAAWLEEAEKRHRGLTNLRAQTADLLSRLEKLDDPTGGLAAAYRQSNALIEEISEAISNLSRNNARSDIVKDAGNILREADAAAQRVQVLEKLVAEIPALQRSLEDAKKTLAALDGERVLRDVEFLRETVDELLDEDSETSIPALESGDPDWDGTLEEQVSELKNSVEEVVQRLEGLEETLVRVEEVRKMVAPMLRKLVAMQPKVNGIDMPAP